MPQFGKKKKIESGDSRGALCPLLANWAMLSILLFAEQVSTWWPEAETYPGREWIYWMSAQGYPRLRPGISFFSCCEKG